MIPIFTIIIVIFLAILTFQLRKTTNAQEEVEEKFWAREREANATRRKDISNLDYITIPDGLFPLNLDSAVENQLAEFFLSENPPPYLCCIIVFISLVKLLSALLLFLLTSSFFSSSGLIVVLMN